MSKFSELARLKELHERATVSEAPNEIWCEYSQNLREAAPWLLRIAEAFQPGDSIMLRELAHDKEQTAKFIAGFGQPDTRKATMLRRLQKAAEELER